MVTVVQASTEIDLEDAEVTRKQTKDTDRELVNELVEQARAEGIELVGENGLLGRLTKLVLESALEGEMTDHLGYDKHERSESNDNGNARNGTGPRRSSPTSARSRSACHAIGTAASTRRSCVSDSGACPAWTRW
ncbi:Transposase, Mutator family [Nonomuraea maritima]|uniref:Transposase, Mutator family n=1 Tax=Nonomuraea maritima TaxID=683260 RepID=A0A1G8UQX5_9ACTN|nr:Transposase, Mutator family [Nonomuraea maritima]